MIQPSDHSRLRRLTNRLRTEHIWALAVTMGIFVFLNTHPVRPHDFWWHLAAGRHVVTSRQIPAVAMETYTAFGKPYPSYNIYWLAETAMYLVYSLGGTALSVLVHALAVGSAYVLTLWLCYRRTRNWRVAALATFFAAALGINDWNVRPQAMVFWLLPLFLLVQDAYEHRRANGLLAVFPVGLAIWVNCHGTFPIGLAIVCLWLADPLWRLLTQSPDRTSDDRALILPALTALGLALLACLANPWGLGIVTYLRTLTTDPVVQSLVTEWVPPSFSHFSGTVFLTGLMLMSAVLAISPRRPRPSQLLAFLAFGFLSLKTSRGIIWFGLALAPTLAEHAGYIAGHLGLASLGHRPSTRLTRVINGILVSLIVLSAVVTLPWFKNALPFPALKAGLVSQETPVAATGYLLSAAPPGELFHDMAFGSYLIWAAQPAYPVFVDPRIELYPEAIWRDYLAISAAQPGWHEKLEQYGINTLMLSPGLQPRLLAAASASQDWRVAYRDTASVLLVSGAQD